MIDKPLISIALATYNGEKYLSALLDSIFSQTYKNIELVVCDDFSTDNTVEILNRYKQTHGLKYYVNETNLGFVKNFERVLLLCSGKYIALADQDDIWFPEKIETLMNVIGDNLLVHSDAVVTNENQMVLSGSFSRYSRKRVDITESKKMLFYNAVTGCTVLFHRSLLKMALPFPDHIIFHDWWLALCAAKSGSIAYCNKALVYYRQSNNISGGAEKMSLKTLISGSLMKGFLADRADKNFKMLNWFKALKNTGYFSDYNRVLEDMIGFHQSFFSHPLRINAFFLFIRYFKYFYPHYKFTTKILILFTCLIGSKKKNRLPASF